MNDHQPVVSRREMVRLGTSALAGSAVLGIGSASSHAEVAIVPEAERTAPLQDPRAQYPKPPFKRQQQESPGLACKMDPQPDHGEKSYRGSGKLTGRKALITGGDSGIGRAAAIAFAREGGDVAFGYLPVEQPDADEVIKLIRDEGRKVVPLPGDIRDRLNPIQKCPPSTSHPMR